MLLHESVKLLLLKRDIRRQWRDMPMHMRIRGFAAEGKDINPLWFEYFADGLTCSVDQAMQIQVFGLRKVSRYLLDMSQRRHKHITEQCWIFVEKHDSLCRAAYFDVFIARR